MRWARRLSIAVVLALVAELLTVGATPAHADAAPTGYTVTPLIGPTATNVTCVQSATSINDQGYVVGQAGFTGSSTADSPVYAFVWHDGTFTELPNPNPLAQYTGDGTCSSSNDAANDQALEITSSNSILGFSAGSNSVVWSSPTAVQSTAVTAGACSGDGGALDMNAAGALSGEYQVDAASGSCTITFPNPYTPAATLQATSSSTPQVLAPTFPASTCGQSADPPYADAFGEAINSKNQVLVTTGSCSFGVSLWQNGTLSTVPLTLVGDPTGGYYRYQLLNDSGVVIGTTSPGQPAYSVDADTAVPLELPAGVTGATPTAINNQGDVIGEVTSGGPEQLILWPGDGSGEPNLAAAPVIVNTLLPSTDHLGTLVGQSINDSGQILAEAHTGTASQEWVVLTPDNGVVVNSTALTPDDPTSLANGVCNTTASTSSGTCTLVAAIQLTNSLGGGTITFNIPNDGTNTFDGDVPQVRASDAVPDLTGPVMIDGSTQPDVGRVELSGTATDSNHSPTGPFTRGLWVDPTGAGSTIRDLVVNGYNDQLFLQGGNDTIQGDWFGTDAAGTAADANPLGTNDVSASAAQTAVKLDSSHNQIGGPASGAGNVMATDWDFAAGLNSQLRPAAVILDEGADTGNVIQGNTIGLVPGTEIRLIQPLPKPLNGTAPEAGLDLQGAETVGGPAAGAGNVIAPAGAVAGSTVVQGNTLYGGLTAAGSTQIGGLTSGPGTARGNTFAGAIDFYDLATDLLVQSGKVVVQGNKILDASRYGVQVVADHATIGGSDPDAGNLIHGNADDPDTSLNAGIRIAGDGNRVEDNTLTNNGRTGLNDAGVLVDSGQGNTITANSMTGNSQGIILGSQGYLDDGVVRNGSGPNHYEYYPNLLDTHSDAAGTQVHVLLDDSGTVTVDLYSVPSSFYCQPFQGKDFLGSRTVHNTLTGEDVRLAFKPLPAGQDGLTATVTSSDGSTSEYSPCLRKDGEAENLADAGVFPLPTTIPITGTATTAKSRPAGTSSSARTTSVKGHGDLVLLCPPRTVRRCIATFRLSTTGPHPTAIAHGRIRLNAGLADRIPITLSPALFAKLKLAHRLKVHLRTVAHDGAKHPHHKTRSISLTLLASP